MIPNELPKTIFKFVRIYLNTYFCFCTNPRISFRRIPRIYPTDLQILQIQMRYAFKDILFRYLVKITRKHMFMLMRGLRGSFRDALI